MIFVVPPKVPFEKSELVSEVKNHFENVHFVDFLRHYIAIYFDAVKFSQIATEKIRKKKIKWNSCGSIIELKANSISSSTLLTNGRKTVKELMVVNIFLFETEVQSVEEQLRLKFSKMSKFEYQKWCHRIYIRFETFQDLKTAFQVGNQFKIQECDVTLLNSRRIESSCTEKRSSKR